jgi:hypothetical protein
MRENSIQLLFSGTTPLIHTQSILLESTGDQLSDGMFAWVLDHVCMCDGASQPSTAELALGTKKYPS